MLQSTITILGIAALALLIPRTSSAVPKEEISELLTTGRAHFEAGNYAAAERSFRKLWSDDSANPDISSELARALMAKGLWSDAVEILEPALPAAERNASFHRLFGEALGRSARDASLRRQLGIAKRGLHHFERAVEIDPRDLEARDSLMEYYLQAPGIAGGGEGKALAQARQTAAVDPAEGRRMLGRIHHAKKRLDAARAAYAEAVRRDPQNVLTRIGQARLGFDLEDWDLAFASLTAALEREPDHPQALFELGRTAERSGRRLQAGVRALEAYTARPRPAFERPASEAWTLLGAIAARSGDLNAARRAYRAALRADPGHKPARKALARLDER